MNTLFSFIHNKLKEEQQIMLMIVMGWHGSSPGKTGFKLAVSTDGQLTGSIGGGAMEHRLVEKAKKELKQEQHLKPYLLFQNHEPDAEENRSGLICSGNQTILHYPLNTDYIPVIEQLLDSIENEQKGVFAISPEELVFEEGKQLKQQVQTEIISEKDWKYQEQMGMPDSVYIFGGGHVGLAVSKLFKMLDFKVHVFDNRHNLNTFEENHFAHEKQIIHYPDAGKYVPDGFNVYVIVVTFAHKSDEQILKEMLYKNIRYLGMMGSEKKISTIYENLKKEGVNPDLFLKVQAPIGIPISSETPEEIAVSIAAQIIRKKNGSKAGN
ncbi:MAG: XdhC family protein [Bacteroidales bacterium]|nr:XdhC family protein [Bacteroidales bacterium]